MKNYTEYVILHDTSVSSTTPNLTTCRLKTDSAAFHVSILRNPNICHKNPKILLKIPKYQVLKRSVQEAQLSPRDRAVRRVS